MALSYAYRILLIGLLPLIAVILYIEGQHYDPALIRFDQIRHDSNTLTRLLPEKVEGFILTGNTRFYTKDNLYEYVNGHAEYFISAGFAGLAVGEYRLPKTPGTEPDLVIDIYDMDRSIQAFGVLSDESGGSLTDIRGLRGFKSPSGLSFTRGPYYVKLSAYNDNAPLEAVAVRIAEATGEKPDRSPEFSGFPDIGTVVTTRFIKEAYRGYDFLNNVTEREYDVGGSTVSVFRVTQETGDISTIVEAFLQYFRTSGIEFSAVDREKSTIYSISDPYEGDWSMIVFPDSLVGVFGAQDETIINKILEKKDRTAKQG